MAVEHRIIDVSSTSPAEREDLLIAYRADGWTPVFRHKGGTDWLRGFSDGFVILERVVPDADDEPRWCAW